MDPYSFRDHVAQVQSRPLATVSGGSAPQLNYLLPFLQKVRLCKCAASLLCASCLISKSRYLMGLSSASKKVLLNLFLCMSTGVWPIFLHLISSNCTKHLKVTIDSKGSKFGFYIIYSINAGT